MEAARTPTLTVELTVGAAQASVILGDAYDLLPLSLPPDSADLLITSPPYWGHRTYTRDTNSDTLAEWCREE